MSSSGRGKCRFIPFDVIKDATDNFNKSNLLGQGGESKVYLADIKLGWKITRVAVKHLKRNSQEFDNEIKIVSKIQHPNILSLLGYCDESGQKILLYKYMENGSLSGYLRKNSSIRLSWLQRLRICIDATRGLQHLHVETDEFPKGIIHRDVKPDNILLDKDWVAKLSDFGMFKVSIAGQLNSTMNTNLKGTTGYYAPEYIAYRAITRMIDVYAFGVVLFQVLCLKMPWDHGDESYYGTDDEDLGAWALQNVDVKLKEEISDDSLKGFIALIGKTLKKDPRKRPTMNGVVSELQKVLKCQQDTLDSAVLSRLKQFSSMKKLKKMALRVIAESLSEEEIGGLTELFRMIDTNNSGLITFEELKAGLAGVSSQLMESEIKDLMDAADIDNSGSIDYGEFLAATLHLNVLEREENLVSAFRYFDRDANGYITIDELQQACQEFGLGEVHLDEMIKEIDQDNDGQIDYGEFAAMMRKGNVGEEEE